MSDLVLAVRQAGYGLKSLARNPRAVVFGTIFPVILLVIFASVFAKGGDETTKIAGEEIAADAYFTAGMIAYAIMFAAFSNVAIALTAQRESGLLKRFRGTPVPAWTFIAAIVIRSVAQVLLITTALLLVGILGYGVDLSAEGVVELVVFVVLGTASLCALGVAITAITTTPESASTIAPFTVVMLAFISGVFVPIDELPKGLVEVGRVFPLAHLAEGLQAAFGTGDVHLSGRNVASLALWGVAGIIIAARRFRWQPHEQ
jgi:ABC-2 type transport system permease protein